MSFNKAIGSRRQSSLSHEPYSPYNTGPLGPAHWPGEFDSTSPERETEIGGFLNVECGYPVAGVGNIKVPVQVGFSDIISEMEEWLKNPPRGQEFKSRDIMRKICIAHKEIESKTKILNKLLKNFADVSANEAEEALENIMRIQVDILNLKHKQFHNISVLHRRAIDSLANLILLERVAREILKMP